MGVRFTYYGGMCFLVERSDGYKALFDPYFNENKHTEKCASDFYDVDAILVSHHAFDHYGDTCLLYTSYADRPGERGADDGAAGEGVHG